MGSHKYTTPLGEAVRLGRDRWQDRVRGQSFSIGLTGVSVSDDVSGLQRPWKAGAMQTVFYKKNLNRNNWRFHLWVFESPMI